jgi:hypothetical protein
MSLTWTQNVAGPYTFPPTGTLSDYIITQIEIAGAGGGGTNLNVITPHSFGGNGAKLTLSSLDLSSFGSQVLNIFIGGGGGGNANNPPTTGAGGGGSSQILTGATVLCVSGGGGGAGNAPAKTNGACSGGDGGTPNGANGFGSFGNYGGGGGSNGSGGNGGSGAIGGNGGGNGSFGNGGNGGGATNGGSGNGGSGNGGNGANDINNYYGGGGGGGYGGGGGGASKGDGLDANAGGGGGGGSFYNQTYITGIVYSTISNGGTDGLKGGDGLITITYTVNNPSQAICLLSDCDILLSDFTLKNITEITLSDEVIGYLSKRPEKIKKVIKRTHFIDFLEDTNKPYLIERSAFGPNVPDKDIHLSGHHRIITQTEDNHFVGVQSFKLDNCKKALNNPDEVDYYHIILENQGAGLIVNNLPVEDCIEE